MFWVLCAVYVYIYVYIPIDAHKICIVPKFSTFVCFVQILKSCPPGQVSGWQGWFGCCPLDSPWTPNSKHAEIPLTQPKTNKKTFVKQTTREPAEPRSEDCWALAHGHVSPQQAFAQGRLSVRGAWRVAGRYRRYGMFFGREVDQDWMVW